MPPKRNLRDRKKKATSPLDHTSDHERENSTENTQTPELSMDTINSGKRSRASPEITAVMLQELVRQIRPGKRSDNGFKAEVWKEVSYVVIQLGGGPEELLTGEKCQSKLENLKKKYDI